MSSSKKLTMKLLIDTNSHKVLFGEAGKEVVDFLFSLLGLPVGAIIKLLTMDRMVGSMGSLYKSLEIMDDTYYLSAAKQRLWTTPMSTISSITMLNKFHVKDVSALKEKTVELDFEKGLELLRRSLKSKTVLTDVFLDGAKKE